MQFIYLFYVKGDFSLPRDKWTLTREVQPAHIAVSKA